MSSPERIRKATDEEVPAIFALAASSVEAPHWTAEMYREYIHLPTGTGLQRVMFVAGERDSLRGFAAVSLLHEEGELESIVVAQASRRTGWGRRLVECASAWACGQGGRRLLLEVRAGNARARAFYAALKFEQVGLRPGYYREPAEDAVLLSRLLAGARHAAPCEL